MEKKEAPSRKDFLDWFMKDIEKNFDNVIFQTISENIIAKIKQYRKETKNKTFYSNDIRGLCDEAVEVFKTQFLSKTQAKKE